MDTSKTHQSPDGWKTTKVGCAILMVMDLSCRKKGIRRTLLAKLLEEFMVRGAVKVLLDCPAEAVDAWKL